MEEGKDKAAKYIFEILEELNTDVFLFTLTRNQIEKLNKYDDEIKIIHLDRKEWQQLYIKNAKG